MNVLNNPLWFHHESAAVDDVAAVSLSGEEQLHDVPNTLQL